MGKRQLYYKRRNNTQNNTKAQNNQNKKYTKQENKHKKLKEKHKSSNYKITKGSR